MQKTDLAEQRMYFPLFISLEGQKCLVVGGGSVALRKVQALKDFNANIVVVSPRVVPELDELCISKAIQVKRKPFSPGDLDGVRLLIVSTNDKDVNKSIADQAARRGIICNVVDQPELCSAIFPSIYSKGRLQIAISTGGSSPAMARFIRQNLFQIFGEEYELALEILWTLRKLIVKNQLLTNKCKNKSVFNRIVSREFVELCKAKDLKSIKELISETVGEAVAERVMDKLYDHERKKGWKDTGRSRP